MCTLVGVTNLSDVKEWMRKNRDETQQTHAYIFDIIAYWL